MFADEFRTDMEEVEAERLVSEATAADALKTWGLEVPLVSPSPARAGWILCATHSAPEEGERRASAGAREGRCSPQWASRCPGHGGAAASSPSGGRPPDGAGGGGPRLQGWGSGGFPWKTLGRCLLRKPNDNPKKENEGWKGISREWR